MPFSKANLDIDSVNNEINCIVYTKMTSNGRLISTYRLALKKWELK